MLRNFLWLLLYNEGMYEPPLTLEPKEIVVSIVIGIIVVLLYFKPVNFHRLFFKISLNARKARSAAKWFLVITALTWIVLSLDLKGTSGSVTAFIIWVGTCIITIISLIKARIR